MFPAPTDASWARSHAGSFRRHGGVIAAPQFVSSFGLKFAARLNSLHGKATRGSLAIELGYWPWEQNICSVTSKATLVNSHLGLTNLPTTLVWHLRRMPLKGTNRRFGVTNTPKTFTRCLRRMPVFEGFWFRYRTSSAETCSTQGNAIWLGIRWLERVAENPPAALMRVIL